MKYMVALPLFLLMLLGACVQKHQDVNQYEGEAAKRTVYTKKSELFLEYSEPGVGQKTEFLLHLTMLDSFKPVVEGSLILTFTPESGESVNVKMDAPAKPGIFKTEITFKQPGKYIMKATVLGKKLTDEIIVDNIQVRDEKEKYENKSIGEKEGASIGFSKEQQWKIDFRAEPPIRKSLSSSFIVMGELIPVSNSEVAVSAPLAGILSVSNHLPYVGQKIARNEVVAHIEPAVHQQGGIGQLSAAYADSKARATLARKEFDRAKRLYEIKAVPQRRVEEAGYALDSAKAALDPLERAMQFMKNTTSDNKIVVRSPLGGAVVELLVSNGKFVEAGQPLMRVVNTSTLWLRVNVPVNEIGKLKNLGMATFTIAGIEGELKPTRLVTVNDVVDPKSRTVPVIFEVSNPKGMFKAGMFADVSVKTGHMEKALTVPEEALFEDEGRFFVYIQRDGESFERRETKVGIRGNGSVQIVDGVKEDERIVTKGGYYVKLASMSARTKQGHGHDH